MYTYDDYKKKKAEYGFDTGGVSDADDRLAQQNPDAGMSLLTYKNDFNTATSDSARAFAHANAEAVPCTAARGHLPKSIQRTFEHLCEADAGRLQLRPEH